MVWYRYGTRIEDVVRQIAGVDRLQGVLHEDVIVVGSRHHRFSPDEIEPDVLGDLFEHEQQPMLVVLDEDRRITEIILRDRLKKVELKLDEEISPLYGILGHTLEITIHGQPERVKRYPLTVQIRNLFNSPDVQTVSLGPDGSDTTIKRLKELVFFADTEIYTLRYRAKELRDHRTLGDYRIPDGANIMYTVTRGAKGVRESGENALTYDDLRRAKESFLDDTREVYEEKARWREERLQRMSIPVTGCVFLSYGLIRIWRDSPIREIKLTFMRDLSNHDFMAQLQRSIDSYQERRRQMQDGNEDSIEAVVLRSPPVSEDDDDNGGQETTVHTNGANHDGNAHGDDGDVDGDDIPPSFRCPITRCIMRDPVVAMDGYTYERTAIEEWIRRAQDGGRPLRSPLTGELMEPYVIANRTFRNSVEEFLQGRNR